MKLHLPKTLLGVVTAAVMMTTYAETLELHTGEQTLHQNQTIDNAQSLDGNTTINGYGYHDPAGYSLTLQAGANVSINGDLFIVSQCHLKIDDGASLSTTGKLSIGHNQAVNPADLTMEGGELTVSQICFNGNHANSASITGGTLTITGSEAVGETGGHNATSTLVIDGTGDASVTLKTGVDNAVTFDYTTLQLGNVTIDADNAQAITITNATLNGVINNQAGADKLVLSGDNTLGSRFVTVSNENYYNADGTETSGNGYLGATYTVDFGTQLTLAEDAAFVFGVHSLQNLIYNETTGTYQAIYTDTNSYYVKVDTSYTNNLTSAANIIVSNGTIIRTERLSRRKPFSCKKEAPWPILAATWATISCRTAISFLKGMPLSMPSEIWVSSAGHMLLVTLS